MTGPVPKSTCACTPAGHDAPPVGTSEKNGEPEQEVEFVVGQTPLKIGAVVTTPPEAKSRIR